MDRIARDFDWLRANQRPGRGPSRRHRGNNLYLNRDACFLLRMRLEGKAKGRGLRRATWRGAHSMAMWLMVMADDQSGIILGTDTKLAYLCELERHTFRRYRDLLMATGDLVRLDDPRGYRFAQWEQLSGLTSPRIAFRLPSWVRVGTRNWTFFQYACSLRGQGWEREAILGELEAKLPRAEQVPGNEFTGAELQKIAASAAKYETEEAKRAPFLAYQRGEMTEEDLFAHVLGQLDQAI